MKINELLTETQVTEAPYGMLDRAKNWLAQKNVFSPSMQAAATGAANSGQQANDIKNQFLQFVGSATGNVSHDNFDANLLASFLTKKGLMDKNDVNDPGIKVFKGAVKNLAMPLTDQQVDTIIKQIVQGTVTRKPYQAKNPTTNTTTSSNNTATNNQAGGGNSATQAQLDAITKRLDALTQYLQQQQKP
jgi:hypothetical protein